jgi:uncharacterized protein YndB with AHSA1/START domain
MELATIQREVQINASPEVVYEVISTPEHLRQWWPDHAELDARPGGTGVVTFGDPGTPGAKVVQITVVEARPAERFSFRWVYDEAAATSSTGLLVTFELTASDQGTLLRFTEAGFREMGWEAAVRDEHYRDHTRGWDHFLPRLVAYAPSLVSTP